MSLADEIKLEIKLFRSKDDLRQPIFINGLPDKVLRTIDADVASLCESEKSRKQTPSAKEVIILHEPQQVR